MEWRELKEDDLIIDDVRENVDRIIFQETLQEILKELPPIEAKVIHHRFWDEMTLRDIGKLIGRSPERVRQHESKALRRLRKPSMRKTLIECGDSWLEIAVAIWEKRLKEAEEKEEKEEKRIEEYYRKIEEKRKKQKHINNFAKEIIPRIRINNDIWVSSKAFQEPKREERSASKWAPSIVKLGFGCFGPYLYSSDPRYSINRNRDPDAYDRWLKQRLDEHRKPISACPQQIP